MAGRCLEYRFPWSRQKLFIFNLRDRFIIIWIILYFKLRQAIKPEGLTVISMCEINIIIFYRYSYIIVKL